MRGSNSKRVSQSRRRLRRAGRLLLGLDVLERHGVVLDEREHQVRRQARRGRGPDPAGHRGARGLCGGQVKEEAPDAKEEAEERVQTIVSIADPENYHQRQYFASTDIRTRSQLQRGK